MRIIEKEVYQFDELSDRARERAREWWRARGLDYGWWDFIYEDFIAVGKCLGIEFDYRSGVNGRGEPTLGEPCIYFSGFSSQGDGACFDGNWSYRKGWRKELKGYAPKDAELVRIGECLQAAAKPKWVASARTKHRGHYYHEHCMDVDVYDCADEDTVAEALRDFACWLYERLDNEYEYINSDECVDESIKSNEYEFDEFGVRV